MFRDGATPADVPTEDIDTLSFYDYVYFGLYNGQSAPGAGNCWATINDVLATCKM